MDPYLLAFSKLAEKVADLLKLMKKEKIRRNNNAAAYFMSLAKALDSVRDGLKARTIPHAAGHEFEGLIRAFESKTRGVLSEEQTASFKKALAEVSGEARTLDSHCVVAMSEEEADRNAKLTMMERLVGDLRGLSGIFTEGAIG